MKQEDADKIREIIRPENISNLSIEELNKYIILANEIFPESDKQQFGVSELASIRARLNAALQTRIKNELEKNINDLKKPHWTTVPIFWLVVISLIVGIIGVLIAWHQ